MRQEVKSRTGYDICIGASPIIWSSNLQSEIASSTTGPEYIATSTACHVLVPLREILKEVASALNVRNEDVRGLILANMELLISRMTPSSKCHWFRQFVSADNDNDGGIIVKKIGTKDQLADSL